MIYLQYSLKMWISKHLAQWALLTKFPPPLLCKIGSFSVLVQSSNLGLSPLPCLLPTLPPCHRTDLQPMSHRLWLWNGFENLNVITSDKQLRRISSTVSIAILLDSLLWNGAHQSHNKNLKKGIVRAPQPHGSLWTCLKKSNIVRYFIWMRGWKLRLSPSSWWHRAECSFPGCLLPLCPRPCPRPSCIAHFYPEKESLQLCFKHIPWGILSTDKKGLNVWTLTSAS